MLAERPQSSRRVNVLGCRYLTGRFSGVDDWPVLGVDRGFASFFPKPGQEDAVEQLLRGMTTPTRQEPGCHIYDLYKSAQAPVSFHLFERYQDQPALDAHRNTEHYKAYRARIPDLLAEPIKVQLLRGTDVRA